MSSGMHALRRTRGLALLGCRRVPVSPPIEPPPERVAARIGVLPALVRLARDRTRSRIAIGFALLAVALGIAFVLAWTLWPRHASNAERFHTMVVARGDVIHRVAATGRVQARTTVEVGTPVSARIADVLVDVGDTVDAGHLLARIEVDGAAQQLTQLRAAVDSASADARRASLELERARSSYARARDQFAGGRRSTAGLDAARDALARAVARRAEALAQGVLHDSALTLARVTMANTGIHSPVAGVVIASHVEPGRTETASPGAVLFVIGTDLDRVHVIASIDAGEVASIAIGQPARLRADAHPKRIFRGEVLELHPDEAVLVVDNDDHALAPGMTVAVEIETAAAHDVLRVLDEALEFRPPDEQRSDGDAVWVLSRKGLRRIPVIVGIGDGALTEVNGELDEGELVIVELTEAGREAYGGDR